MALPVKIFRWDDVGAPQLVSRRPSEIINILRKCLVDGYGSKEPLGWTLSFESVTPAKMVFRNSPIDGSGGVIRFADYNGDDRVGGAVTFTHGKVANDIDTIIPPHVYSVIGAIGSANTEWVIIGTSKSFFLIISNTSRINMASGTNFSGTWWFGDIDPTLAYDNATMSATYNSNTNNSSNSWDSSLDYTSPNSFFATMYDANNTDFSADHMLHLPVANLNISSPTSDVYSLGIPAGNLLLVPVLIMPVGVNYATKDAFDVYLKDSDSRPLVRGSIPGLYYFIQGGFADQPWPQIRTQNGRTYWILRQGHVGSSQMCIDLDSWYE